MTECPQIRTKSTIAFLVYPGFQILDATGPLAAFEIAERFHPGAYRVVTAAPRAGLVRASSGLGVEARGLAAAREADTLIVAGGDGVREAVRDVALLRFLRRAGLRTRRIASVCSGAYLLAAAGLLHERRVTTHWRRAAHFAAQFPRVRVEPDRIYVRDGPVWTSAGISAGIDLALALIEDDLGEEAAKTVARQLVVYHRRPGGQSQYSALLDLGRPRGRFDALLRRAGERLGERLSVEDLASEAAMSPRNFARAFKAETGVTPACAIERLRVEAARGALERPGASLGRIARDVGFGDTERMRRAFVRVLGRPPQAFKAERAAAQT